LQDVRQHPWALPTRCQEGPAAQLGQLAKRPLLVQNHSSCQKILVPLPFSITTWGREVPNHLILQIGTVRPESLFVRTRTNQDDPKIIAGNCPRPSPGEDTGMYCLENDPREGDIFRRVPGGCPETTGQE
jgi:hypothetical protein